ncbi:MAG: trypsin-like peptidase domain-containing protein [Spirochaetales bacterium]|nr:trypsin-like peptidase domain-containing protein [Spirochaetales bacterium]
MKKLLLLLFIMFPILITCVTDPDKPTGPVKSTSLEQALTENTVRIIIKENGKETSSGSGFLITYKNINYIITNFHVIGYGDEESIIISRKNKDRRFEMFYDTNVIIQDPENDLAVLQVPGMEKWGKGLPVASERSVLESVVIPGFPPHIEETDITFSTGKISNPGVTIDGKKRIKLDIAVSPGNSGGPLVNERCEVLGVVYMKITKSAVENVAYAIPIIEALELIDSIENHTDEKIVKEILNEKVRNFLLFIQFYNKDSLVPLSYFTHEYNKVFQAGFLWTLLIANSICTNDPFYSIEDLPNLSTYRGKKLLNEIYIQAEDVNLFDLIGFKESDDEYKTVLLAFCYRYMCHLMESLSKFQSDADKINISVKDYEDMLSIYTDRLSKLYINCIINDIVMYRFKDSEIDSFEIVDIMNDLSPSIDKCTARIFIKIKYSDSLKNLKIQAAYSRGRWGISSVTGAAD